MRFLFYEKITKLEKGRSVTGIKNFALSEEFFRHHFTKKPLIPGVIFIEAMAQVLGWLIIYSMDFNRSAIMTLVEDVNVPACMRPGITAEIHGEIITLTKRDSLGRAWINVDGREVARINRIIYTHTTGMDRSGLIRWFEYYTGMRVEK